jgi:O-antigen ligase
MPDSSKNAFLLRIPFLLAFGLLPLVFWRTAIDPWNLPRLLGLPLFLVVFASLSIFKKESSLQIPRLFGALVIVWLGWTTLSLLNAPNAGEAYYLTSLKILLVGLAIWLGSQRNAPWAIPVLCLFASVEALIAAGELAGWVQMKTFTSTPAGTTGNNNLYGTLVALLAPFPLMLLQKGKKALNVSLLLLVLLLLATMVLSDSKSAMLGTALAALATALGFGVSKRMASASEKAKRLASLALTSPVLLLMAAPILWSLFYSPPPTDTGIAERINSTEERGILWEKSREMIAERPLLGLGPAGWKYEILKKGLTAYTEDFAGRYFPAPHNDYLWLATESGLPAALAYVALLLWLFFCAMRRALSSAQNQARWRSLLLGAGVVVWATISGFQFPLERIDHLIVLAAYMGLLLSGEAAKPLPAALGKVSLAAVVLLSAGTFCLAVMRFEGETNLSKALLAEKKGNWTLSLKATQTAESALYTTDYASSTPLAWHRGIAEFQQGQFAEATRSFREAAQVNPWHPHVLNNLGSAYAASGQLDSAVVWYQKTLEIFPRFADAAINLSLIYAAQGDTAKALQTLEEFPKGNGTGNQRVRQQARNLGGN